jgi:protein-disulfide isomerase
MAEGPAAVGDPDPQETVVVLAIPRRAARTGPALAALVVLGLVAGVVAYRLLDNRSDAGRKGQENIPLPQPVTFIAPTSEPRAAAALVSVSPDDDPSRGSLDAPVVMIEFSDYQCHYCGVFARETLHPLLALYGDQIRFVYRDFVFYGPVSLQAAIAAECANEQNAFWPYHDLLFEFQDELNRDRMFDLARSIDLDMELFSACLDDPAMEAEVKADTGDGLRLDVRGTPTFFINGRILVGAAPLDTFATLIDEELAAASSPQD